MSDQPPARPYLSIPLFLEAQLYRRAAHRLLRHLRIGTGTKPANTLARTFFEDFLCDRKRQRPVIFPAGLPRFLL
jgi:hypothetical protein